MLRLLVVMLACDVAHGRYHQVKHINEFEGASNSEEDLTEDELFPFEPPAQRTAGKKLQKQMDGKQVASQTNKFNNLVAELSRFSQVSEVCMRAFLLDIPFDLQIEQDSEYTDQLAKCPQNIKHKVEKYDKKFGKQVAQAKSVQKHKNKTLEEEVVHHKHKGEFETVTDLLMAIEEASGVDYFDLMSALSMAALMSDKNVHVMTNGFRVGGGAYHGFSGAHPDAFRRRVREDITAGLDRAKGQRLYFKNGFGFLRGRLFTDEEIGQVRGRLGRLTDASAPAGLNVRSDGPWMRDYGPLFTCDAAAPGTSTSTSFSYPRNADDYAFSGNFAAAFGPTAYARMQIDHDDNGDEDSEVCGADHCEIVGEGGNIQVDGGGKCAVSRFLLTENQEYSGLADLATTEARLVAELEDKLGCTNTIILPNLYMEGTKHVDMYIAYTARNRMVMGIYTQAQDARNRRIMLANKALIRGRGTRVNVMPMPSRCPLNELPQYMMTLARINGGDLNIDGRHELDDIVPATAGLGGGELFEDAYDLNQHIPREVDQIRVIRAHKNPAPGRATRQFDALMAKMRSGYGVRRHCDELDVPDGHARANDDYEGSGFVHRSYANALIIENVVVVPIYAELLTRGSAALRKSHKKTMKKALKVWLAQPTINLVMTGYADNQIEFGGAAHCTTQTIRECA